LKGADDADVEEEDAGVDAGAGVAPVSVALATHGRRGGPTRRRVVHRRR
jgi:hypothetical protein